MTALLKVSQKKLCNVITFAKFRPVLSPAHLQKHTYVDTSSFLLVVVYDGDDKTIYDVDRRLDDWFVLLMAPMDSLSVKKLAKDCELANTHWDGRQIELKPMYGSPLARYSGKPGALVGPPKNGMVFVEVDAHAIDVRAAEEDSSGGTKRKRALADGDGKEAEEDASLYKKKIKLLLKVSSNKVCDPQREPGVLVGDEWSTFDDETPNMVARKFGVNVKDVVAINRSVYPGLLSNSKLQPGTILVLPPGAGSRYTAAATAAAAAAAAASSGGDDGSSSSSIHTEKRA